MCVDLSRIVTYAVKVHYWAEMESMLLTLCKLCIKHLLIIRFVFFVPPASFIFEVDLVCICIGMYNGVMSAYGI